MMNLAPGDGFSETGTMSPTRPERTIAYTDMRRTSGRSETPPVGIDNLRNRRRKSRDEKQEEDTPDRVEGMALSAKKSPGGVSLRSLTESTKSRTNELDLSAHASFDLITVPSLDASDAPASPAHLLVRETSPSSVADDDMDGSRTKTKGGVALGRPRSMSGSGISALLDESGGRARTWSMSSSMDGTSCKFAGGVFLASRGRHSADNLRGLSRPNLPAMGGAPPAPGDALVSPSAVRGGFRLDPPALGGAFINAPAGARARRADDLDAPSHGRR
jgi:hypothetical protein